MARPAEKARAMLNKWVRMREEGNAPVTKVRGKRPHLASACEHLSDAEYYRDQINREIAGMIDKIQNPALEQHTLRDMNDEINRKFREKHHWNKRIHELSDGAIDYNKKEYSAQIEEGDAQFVVGTNRGKRQGPIYRYFGAAKDLPGVKELLERQQEKMKSMQVKKRSPVEIYKHVNGSYFGWQDEEDGTLLEIENDSFDKYCAAATAKRQKIDDDDDDDNGRDDGLKNNEKTIKVIKLSELLSNGDDYMDGVPTQEEMKHFLFNEKKKALLAKFS